MVTVYLSSTRSSSRASIAEIAAHPESLARVASASVRPAANPAGDGRGHAAAVPQAGARTLGLRDRRRRHAAREGRRRRRPERPAARIRNTRKLLRTAALIMSVLLIGSAVVTDAADPGRGVRRPAAPATGRALAYLAHATSARSSALSTTSARSRSSGSPGASAMAGPAEPRAALPAALRHGAGLGARVPAAGAGHHGHRLPRHRRLQRRRRRAGRGVRDRRAGADDLRGDRGDARARASGGASSRVRRRSRWSSSTRRSSTSSNGRTAFRSPPGSSCDHRARRWCRACCDRRSCGSKASMRRRSPASFMREAASPAGADHRQSSRHRLPDEYARKLRERARTRITCRRTRRCCSSRSAPGDASDFSASSAVEGVDVGGFRVLAVHEPGDPECDRRPAARSPRSHRTTSARLLRLDGRQSDRLPAQVPRVRRRATPRR